MKEVSIKDIKNISNLNIIDVRDNYSYNLSHIKGSLNIPYYSLITNYNIYLDKRKRYYLYCEYGKQSKELSNKLNILGYDTYYVKEGFLDFKNLLK